MSCETQRAYTRGLDEDEGQGKGEAQHSLCSNLTGGSIVIRAEESQKRLNSSRDVSLLNKLSRVVRNTTTAAHKQHAHGACCSHGKAVVPSAADQHWHSGTDIVASIDGGHGSLQRTLQRRRASQPCGIVLRGVSGQPSTEHGCETCLALNATCQASLKAEVLDRRNDVIHYACAMA